MTDWETAEEKQINQTSGKEMKDFQGFFKLFTFFVQKVYLVLSKASNNNFFGLLIVTQLFLISSVNHKENTQFFLSMGCLATCLEGMSTGHKSKYF